MNSSTCMCTQTTWRRRRRRSLVRNHVVVLVIAAVALMWPVHLSETRTRATAYSLSSTSTNSHTERLPSKAVSLVTRKAATRTTELGLSSLRGDSSCSEAEFELHVGRALDTLRRDYPRILTNQPDFSIYDGEIEVVDPSGVKVHGLSAYKNTFRILHALVKFIYCPSRSGLTFRMCFDKARQNIRIHWNAEVVPREIFGGLRTTLFVDGISVYELDRGTGKIIQHRIEQLLMNNMPVMPKEGVIAALRDQHTVTVPSFAGEDVVVFTSRFDGGDEQNRNIVFPFQPQFVGLPGRNPTSLFAMEATSNDSDENSAKGQDNMYPDLDWEALERKNKSRKKFGLKPMTPEEFMQVEAQVKQMDMDQKQRAADAAAAAAATEKTQKPNLFDKVFGAAALKDTCETNYDCARPELCCDFGFIKKCCNSGSLVGLGNYQQRRYGQLVPVPVPVEVPRDGGMPRDGGRYY